MTLSDIQRKLQCGYALAGRIKDLMNQSDGVSSMSSSDVLERINELEEECKSLRTLILQHGQYVASSGMDDAIDGLRKTRGCWNNAIAWPRLK